MGVAVGGRGVSVSVAVGSGVSVGVAVGSCVSVGVAVGGGVSVGACVGEGVRGVWVGVGGGVWVDVAVGDGLAVPVTVGVRVAGKRGTNKPCPAKILVDDPRQFAVWSRETVVPVARLMRNRVSPGWTVYWTHPGGLAQVMGGWVGWSTAGEGGIGVAVSVLVGAERVAEGCSTVADGISLGVRLGSSGRGDSVGAARGVGLPALAGVCVGARATGGALSLSARLKPPNTISPESKAIPIPKRMLLILRATLFIPAPLSGWKSAFPRPKPEAIR